MARQTDEPAVEEAPLGCWDSFMAFMAFVYNPNEGTVLGRGGKSWGRLLVFYTFYYLFLACLFIASITICFNCLDKETPYYQTRLESPGVTIQPKISSFKSLERDIIFKESDPDSYAKYTDQLTEFLKPYNPENQTEENNFIDCDGSLAKDFGTYGRTDVVDDERKVCKFSTSQLGNCGSGQFGYDKGQPCVLVKLNRVINWTPLGYFLDEDKAKDFPWSKAPALSDVLGKKKHTNNQLYVSCYGLKEEDQENLNGETGVSKKTKIKPKGLGFGFYPYRGKVIQPHYLSPIVGVQFTNVKRNVLINVGCKVYAQNILENDKLESGFFKFKLQIDE